MLRIRRLDASRGTFCRVLACYNIARMTTCPIIVILIRILAVYMFCRDSHEGCVWVMRVNGVLVMQLQYVAWAKVKPDVFWTDAKVRHLVVENCRAPESRENNNDSPEPSSLQV